MGTSLARHLNIEPGVIPVKGRNVVTMSVKPSDF